MDPMRFDTLARTFAARLPRRSLGPLAAALLALGLGQADAKVRKNGNDAKGRTDHKGRKDATDGNNSQNEQAKKRRDHPGQGNDRHGSPADHREDHGAGGAKAAKKKAKCVSAGGSCTKPKKGKKPKKCCAGLRCDAGTSQCSAPVGDASVPPPPPPDGGVSCGQGLQTCNAGCLPTDETCCPVGQRPCDGSCSAADICCVTEFSACMAPVAAEWDAAVAACSGACATPESDSCQACALEVLETFADPLMTCIEINCMGPSPGAGTAASQSRQAAAGEEAAAPRYCSPQDLRECKAKALIQTAASLGYEIPLAILEGPIIGTAALLLNAGKLAEDYRACEAQFGCPTGTCIPEHGVCCDGPRNCANYDPNTKICKGCPEGKYCSPFSQLCEKDCKECHQYLVGGRQMPCGTIMNNCGVKKTCDGCPTGKRCVNRLCVAVCPTGSQQRARAAGDEANPMTGPEFCTSRTPAYCGTVTDDCGGTVECGDCRIEQYCDDTNTCVDPDCLGDPCTASNDGNNVITDSCCPIHYCNPTPPQEAREAWTGTCRSLMF